MSKQVSPMAVGTFILSGLGLLILAVLIFGNGQLFKPKIRWVVYFDSSLNGLNVGAPVKVQGVEVGIVKEIHLQLDAASTRLWKPVVLEIEPGRVGNVDGSPLMLPLTSSARHKMMEGLIETGLRARLEVQSILTGLLYVNLDFVKDQPARLTGLKYDGLPEVPSVPPRVDEVLGTIEELAKKINNMPIETLISDLAATVQEVRVITSSEETKRSRIALTKALEDAQQMLAKLDKQLPDLIGDLGQASRSVNLTADETTKLIKDVHGQILPLIQSADRALLNASATLENISALTEADSSLHGAVEELRDAGRSIKVLSDYLERHPDAIVFGKPD